VLRRKIVNVSVQQKSGDSFVMYITKDAILEKAVATVAIKVASLVP
jgi:hypothetical protein